VCLGDPRPPSLIVRSDPEIVGARFSLGWVPFRQFEKHVQDRQDSDKDERREDRISEHGIARSVGLSGDRSLVPDRS